MKPVSLADISYEQGLQLLFLRKQAVDAGQLPPLPTAAFTTGFVISPNSFSKAANPLNLSDLGSRVGKGLRDFAQQGKAQWGSLDPASKNVLLAGLLGSGAGAVTGLGQAYTSGEGNYLSNALRGGLAGGAIGGGLGLAFNPAVAEKLQAQTSAAYDAAKKQLSQPATASPPPTPAAAASQSASQTEQPTAQSATKTPPTVEELLSSKRDAESITPELVYGGAGAAGALGTAKATQKLLSREFYDPTALVDAVVHRSGEIGEKPQGMKMTSRQAAIGQLFEGNAGKGPALAQRLAASPMDAGSKDTQQMLLRQLAQQRHGVRSLGRAGIDPKTLQLATTALNMPEEQVKKMLLRGGARGLTSAGARGAIRLGPIAALLAAAGYGGSRLLDAYRSSAAERQQAAGNYSNLMKQLIPGQTAGAP